MLRQKHFTDVGMVGLMFGLTACIVTLPNVAAQDSASKGSLQSSAYEHTAIGAVLKANGNRVPENGLQFMQALKKVGDFAQLPVPFSAVNQTSGLTTPRVVLAPRPGIRVREVDDLPTRSPGGSDGTPVRDLANPISTAGLTEATVEGRLFFAANMEKGQEGTPQVRIIEFISWNSRKKQFDFGIIDCREQPASLQILDSARCISCHKNQGPILGQGPWSNTTHNDVVRTAALGAFLPNDVNRDPLASFPPLRSGVAGLPILTPEQKEKTTYDGISLVHPDPEVCDAAVRLGGQLVRNRDIYRAMTKSEDGRRALVLLLTAVASPLPIEQSNRKVKAELDRTFHSNYGAFLNEVVSINRSKSDMLADFSPSGSMGRLRTDLTNVPTGWGSGSSQRKDVLLTWSGNRKMVIEYDLKRSEGETEMPSQRRPSNPKAFVRPGIGVPPRPSAVVDAAGLARTIGLTEGDRKFMADRIANLTRQINLPNVTFDLVAKDVFNAPSMIEPLQAKDIPDREEFKDRFVAALEEVAMTLQLSTAAIDRKLYASGPIVASSRNLLEPVMVSTTTCFRCHEVSGIGKSSFNPTPLLEFDPFDKPSREAWVKKTGTKKRVEVLSKLMKRLVTDKDMPPEETPEFDKYRTREKSASFDAIKDWLEGELMRARAERID